MMTSTYLLDWITYNIKKWKWCWESEEKRGENESHTFPSFQLTARLPHHYKSYVPFIYFHIHMWHFYTEFSKRRIERKGMPHCLCTSLISSFSHYAFSWLCLPLVIFIPVGYDHLTICSSHKNTFEEEFVTQQEPWICAYINKSMILLRDSTTFWNKHI